MVECSKLELGVQMPLYTFYHCVHHCGRQLVSVVTKDTVNHSSSHAVISQPNLGVDNRHSAV